MRWEELTGDEFGKAVANCGRVCLLAMGVIERHGPHLPLGTDMLNGLHVCARAAEVEPAIVFPPWYFGQIYEARCFPGTITIPPPMLLELLLHVLDEIGRNGFTKVIMYLAHGGNNSLGPFLAQCQLAAQKPYQLYVYNPGAGATPEEQAARKAILTTGGGHADEGETSTILSHRPELAKMDAVGDRSGQALGRMSHLRQCFTGFHWYADFPEHFAGDARPASAEKGRKLVEIQVAALARFIRAVKTDRTTPQLAEEFFARERKLRENM